MDGITDGAINIPQQASFDLPVDVPYITQDSLVFSYETGSGPATFHATIDHNSPVQISGLFRREGEEFPFMLIKENPEGPSEFGVHTETHFTIDANAHSISGSMVTPRAFDDSTLVILTSGSGAQTRNSNIAGFELFRELAMQLANRGYFSFRYDDRGVGESTGEPDATLKELAGDLVHISTFFSEQAEQPFKSIVFLGHSQGGLVSLLASEEFTPRQLVLLSSPTLPGSDIITQQIELISEARNVPEDIMEENLAFQRRVYEAVRSGSGWDKLEDDIATRLKEQINELPEEQKKTLGDMDQFIKAQVNRQLEGAKTRWFQSFIDMDPGDLLENIQAPTLALFAENDTQVLAEVNREVIAGYNGFITVKTISDANHLFQLSESGLPSEYGLLEKQFAEGFINEIATFLDEFDKEGI